MKLRKLCTNKKIKKQFREESSKIFSETNGRRELGQGPLEQRKLAPQRVGLAFEI